MSTQSIDQGGFARAACAEQHCGRRWEQRLLKGTDTVARDRVDREHPTLREPCERTQTVRLRVLYQVDFGEHEYRGDRVGVQQREESFDPPEIEVIPTILDNRRHVDIRSH